MSHTETKEVEYLNGHRVRIGGKEYSMGRTCRMWFDPSERTHRCSGCGKALASAAIGMALGEWSYCPACGARMVVG